MSWVCEAYGPTGVEVGAVCFMAGRLGERVCATEGQCRDGMAEERRRVFRRMSELAATGDETFAYLEGEFTNPDQLLGGPGETPAENGP